MQFASLGSGSKGNGTLIRSGNLLLLADCGFSLKETEKRLAKLDVAPEQINAVLVTHEHNDHIGGVGPLARKYQLPVYMTAGTARSQKFGQVETLQIIQGYRPFFIEDIKITPVAVPHDAAEPAQFIFEKADKRLGLLTDLGSISPHVEEFYDGCDALILEANHDPLMLASGPYPYSLKQRVAGAWGHLSNQQASGFLARLNTQRLQLLVVAHISQQNNCLTLAKETLAASCEGIEQVIYACQDEGFEWLSIR